MHPHETYMQRCLQLALLGAGSTAPNPMVGAVLVQGGRIIGEGHTQPYGGPHAEVMCLRSVAAADNGLLAQATLYVSLEPCAHHGKTPPCTDLIIRSGIPRVVIGCGDPFEQVNGRGIAQLQAAGVQVTEGVLEAECKALNKSFFTYHQRQRPYIILKWAQSGNGYIAATGQRTAISGPMANRLVHRWRSEAMAIMVGAQTAIIDNPHLTVRLWEGKNPLRIVAAGNTPLSSELHLFNGEAPTLVFARQQGQRPENVRYHLIDNDGHEVSSMLTTLYQQRINSVLVEGGAKLLQNFIDSGLWDEARVITNTGLHIPAGTKAPVMQNAKRAAQQQLGPDNIVYYVHSHSLLGMLDSSSTAANT